MEQKTKAAFFYVLEVIIIETKSMPFTPEQMKQVFETNIINFAQQNGFEVEKGDRHTRHVKGHGGLYLFNHGRGFHCFTTEKSGNIIEFAQEYFGLDFINAVEMILGCKAYEHCPCEPATEKETRGELVLPQKAESFKQAIAYLVKTRGIDKDIVYSLISEKKIFQSTPYNNCCFVGYDRDNKARYCSMRGTITGSSFKKDADNSDKSYPFHIKGKSNRVYTCESPIDAMSHATLTKLHGMDWTKDHRISTGCLSDKALNYFLQEHSEVKEIVFCFDNDVDGKLPDGTPRNHGQVTAQKYSGIYADGGYRVFIQTPHNKDFNLDLLAYRAAQSRIEQLVAVQEASPQEGMEP